MTGLANYLRRLLGSIKPDALSALKGGTTKLEDLQFLHEVLSKNAWRWRDALQEEFSDRIKAVENKGAKPPKHTVPSIKLSDWKEGEEEETLDWLRDPALSNGVSLLWQKLLESPKPKKKETLTAEAEPPDDDDDDDDEDSDEHARPGISALERYCEILWSLEADRNPDVVARGNLNTFADQRFERSRGKDDMSLHCRDIVRKAIKIGIEGKKTKEGKITRAPCLEFHPSSDQDRQIVRPFGSKFEYREDLDVDALAEKLGKKMTKRNWLGSLGHRIQPKKADLSGLPTPTETISFICTACREAQAALDFSLPQIKRKIPQIRRLIHKCFDVPFGKVGKTVVIPPGGESDENKKNDEDITKAKQHTALSAVVPGDASPDQMLKEIIENILEAISKKDNPRNCKPEDRIPVPVGKLGKIFSRAYIWLESPLAGQDGRFDQTNAMHVLGREANRATEVLSPLVKVLARVKSLRELTGKNPEGTHAEGTHAECTNSAASIRRFFWLLRTRFRKFKPEIVADGVFNE